MYYCDMNDKIDTVFDYDTSNEIADILIDEINNILQTIAPSKLIQYKSRYSKWYNKDIQAQADIKDRAHDKAKKTNDPDDWRQFRRQRNKYNNDIKTAKKKYYYNRLTLKGTNDKKDTKLKDCMSSNNKLWSTVKDMTNNSNRTPPRHIDHNNRQVTSLRQIADIANRLYIDKIDKIRQNFNRHRLTHMDILKMIIL